MIKIERPNIFIDAKIKISGSKSISNRVLLLNHLLNANLNFQNCSDSEDSKNLISALKHIQNNSSSVIDVKHAGTNMRFLTAYLSNLPGDWILTGSDRMKQRPIAELVNALKQIGAQIKYLENDGFPSLQITGQKLNGGSLQLKANISSQYISALLLAAPLMQNGLVIELIGQAVSKPYIEMTIVLLQELGVEIEQKENLIRVKPKTVSETKVSSFLIESDWSSASYWYSICALSPNSKIELNSFFDKSLQADSVLKNLYTQLGVVSSHENNQLTLTHKGTKLQKFEYNFIDCPDIAQTIAVTCVGLGIEAHLKGLSTLKIKETDRIEALKTELEKLGARIEVSEDGLTIFPANVEALQSKTFDISTYNDHRMALSFAPLALICNSILMDDALVIDKSYTAFWQDLKSAGFSVNLTP